MRTIGYNYRCRNVGVALSQDGVNLAIKLRAFFAGQQQNRKRKLLDVCTADFPPVAFVRGAPNVIENYRFRDGWKFFPRSWTAIRIQPLLSSFFGFTRIIVEFPYN
jgi:hypothetical protein